MDISMPRLDGVTAASRILNGSGPNQSTPIVALTAHALPEDIGRFRDAGFGDVLVKPLSRRRLAEVLAGRFGAITYTVAETDELEDTLGSEAAARVRAKALSEIAAALDDMGTRIREGVPHAELSEAAHRMAGLSGLVGLSDVHLGMTRLHEALGHPDAAGIPGLIAEMRGLLDEVRDVA
jgi:response regulator RpfG family c-di-GMP phosphodiesterase